MESRRHLANAIRALSMDAVEKAKSGHPGAPMGMADIAEVLWRDYLKHNPRDPSWYNRDRFVLSNGHGSMLLYALLHLSGYELPLEELKNFRQLHSKTPGHPEYGYAPGVETTTGPLGQGLANAVGMAIAEQTLAAQFNQTGFSLIDHHTYVFLGDGCLMEGISHEVSSLAGTLGLGKLIAFWDDNGISIDGHVEGWFTDDTPARFRAYGWQVIEAVDGHDAKAIKKAIDAARNNATQPSLICCKTVIGFGAPNKAGSHDCHGAPLGDDEVAAARKQLNWPHAPFEIPEDIYTQWDATDKGMLAQSQWNQLFAGYEAQFPEQADELKRRLAGRLPNNWAMFCDALISELQEAQTAIATRQASLKVLEAFAHKLPELLGGSADLAPSNLTKWSSAQAISRDTPQGNYLHYGVREFGMSAILNGLTLHGGFKPFGGTFLMFMEYARNAVRMAALMKQPSIFLYTHDSIGLGEDGPTHQAVEQLANLRTTPNMHTWRPCDSVETAVAWRFAIEQRHGPSALVFSRQALEPQPRNHEQLSEVAKGAYILKDTHKPLELIIIATGSEVEIAIAAANALSSAGHGVRVVSMPCCELFDKQSLDYQHHVLPPSMRKRIAIEAGIGDYWRKYVGLDGHILAMNSFGESAPAKDLYAFFGFDCENLVCIAKEML